MTDFNPGDTVTVELKGRDHPAEVIDQKSGYIMCRVHMDPEWDYGRTTWIDPGEQTVCVKQTNVRKDNP